MTTIEVYNSLPKVLYQLVIEYYYESIERECKYMCDKYLGYHYSPCRCKDIKMTVINNTKWPEGYIYYILSKKKDKGGDYNKSQAEELFRKIKEFTLCGGSSYEIEISYLSTNFKDSARVILYDKNMKIIKTAYLKNIK